MILMGLDEKTGKQVSYSQDENGILHVYLDGVEVVGDAVMDIWVKLQVTHGD